MSNVDKVIAAATPPESEEQRLDARNKANAAALPATGSRKSWTITLTSGMPSTTLRKRPTPPHERPRSSSLVCF